MSSKFKSIKDTNEIYITPYKTENAKNGLTLKFEYKDMSISVYKVISEFLKEHGKITETHGYIISDKPPETFKQMNKFMCFESVDKPLMIHQVVV